MFWYLGDKGNAKPPPEASWQKGLYGQAWAPHFESLHYASAPHTKKLFWAKIKQQSEISCLEAFLAWQGAQHVVSSGDRIRKSPSKFPSMKMDEEDWLSCRKQTAVVSRKKKIKRHDGSNKNSPLPYVPTCCTTAFNLLIKLERPLEHATAAAPKKFLSNLVLPRTAEFTVWGSLAFKL